MQRGADVVVIGPRGDDASRSGQRRIRQLGVEEVLGQREHCRAGAAAERLADGLGDGLDGLGGGRWLGGVLREAADRSYEVDLLECLSAAVP